MVTVPKLWPGETVVCIGGGPSLTAEDVDACRGRARIIAISDAYRLAPWSDVLYSCDAKWWDWHQGVSSFHGPKYALQSRASKWGVKVLRNTGQTGLELEPTGLKTGAHSGYQAINLAVHLGAARILLLGYDARLGPKNEAHWFGDHPRTGSVPKPRVDLFVSKMPSLVAPLRALGIEVVNCSRRTALTCFPRLTLQEALLGRLEAVS